MFKHKLCLGNLLILIIIFQMFTQPVHAYSQKFVEVSCGQSHTVALDENNSVWTWGRTYNDNGLPYRDQYLPEQVPIDNVVAVSAGNSHTLALKNDGTVWTWGYNSFGQLGDGTYDNKLIPIRIKKLNNISYIYSGSYAIQDDGTVWAWGTTFLETDDTGHALEDTPLKINTISEPIKLPWLKDIKSIDTGFSNTHTLFVKNDGTVWAWGYNSFGQLGDGSYTEKDFPYVRDPVKVSGLEDVKEVKSGFSDSIAVKNDGTVWAWGLYNGKLTGGSKGSAQITPAEIFGINNVTSISHDTQIAFLKNDGSIWMSGQNHAGQIGDGTTEEKFAPIYVLGPNNVKKSPEYIQITYDMNKSIKKSDGTLQEVSTISVPGFDSKSALIAFVVMIILNFVLYQRKKL